MTKKIDKTESKARVEVLRKLMDKYDLNAPDVAQILRIRPQTVRCYMCGVRVIPKRHLKRLTSFLESLRTGDRSKAVSYSAPA